MRGNDWGNLLVGEGCEEGVDIIGPVGDEGGGIGVLEQRLGTNDVVGLSWRKHHLHGIAQGIDERVDFGAQSATRAADRLLAVFLRAPALC